MRTATKVSGTSVWISGFIFHTALPQGAGSVRFLVDTGAGSTSVLQGAAKDLGVDFALLEKHPSGTTGISGPHEAYVMKNTSLLFLDEQTGMPILLKTDMNVLKPDPRIGRQLSFALFGTDLLSGFRFEYDLPDATLETKGEG